MKVPDVLVSDNHEDIQRWRRRSALEKTLRNRPDLLDQADLSEYDKELLAEIAGGESQSPAEKQVPQGLRPSE